jgi:hypothetical protein
MYFFSNSCHSDRGRHTNGGRCRETEKGRNTKNYEAFFILGISFLPVGIVLMVTTGNPGFIGMTGLGLVYTIIGLTNRDKWKK